MNNTNSIDTLEVVSQNAIQAIHRFIYWQSALTAAVIGLIIALLTR